MTHTRHKDSPEPDRAEDLLQRIPDAFRGTFMAAGIPMAIRNLDLKPIIVNQAYSDIYGYGPEEFQAMAVNTVLPVETYRLYMDEIRPRVLEGGYWEGEYRLRDKEGRPFAVWARFDPVTDDSGATTHVVSVMRDASAAMRLRNALAQTERHLNFLTANASDCLFRVRFSDGRYDFVSRTVETMTGYPRERFQTTDAMLLTITPRKWRPTLMKWWAELQQGKVRPSYESPVRHRDGSTRWINQRVALEHDLHGIPIAAEGIITDVTERKEHEEALQESEARFRSLFEDCPISLWEEDLSGLKTHFDTLRARGVTDFRKFFTENPDELATCGPLVKVVDVNRATLDMLRADTKDELLGNLDKVFTEESMDTFREEMILLASGGTAYCGEITHRTLAGETIWVMVHFSVPPQYRDKLSRVIVSLQDMTPRKRAELALKYSEERYRVLVENAREGVMVIQDSEAKFVNEALHSMLGYSPSEQLELLPGRFLHPDDRETATEQAHLTLQGRKQGPLGPFRIQTRDQSRKWVHLSVKPIVWEDRPALLKIVTDVTEHKELEEELRRAHAETEQRVCDRTAELDAANAHLRDEIAERRQAEAQILSLTQQLLRIQENERQRISRDLHDNVAQDLSSMVIGMATLFDGYDDIPDEVRQRGAAIANVMRQSVSSVRHIAYGLRPPSLDQLGLSRAISRHCNDVEEKYGLRVDFSAAGVDKIRLDSDTEINVFRMIQESLNNAVKHSDANRVKVRVLGSHPDILIRVEDDGRGFDVKQRMADAAEEHHMGLKSMEERARLLGGTMNIRSRQGAGTKIAFRIPYEHPRRQP
ncbi:PAS domain-containing sensor histidine kinase [Pseudodesulfovibrio tunisiensis]|uniref:PAS domain-containing sensor histidine kinase n=1 Tax=Pseudodesulfovibrio tunisiensis TaxID=463192 RepID=UPI001FB4443F|nr:PAS domain S-box protein [Pseudodesulfovibrio tunisiensis]